MMTITQSLTVNVAADKVWHMIGPEFADVARWMAAIPRSEPIKGAAIPGAPVRGRNSYLIEKFNGMYQEETITSYDEEAMRVGFDVIIRNGPKAMPLKGYASTVIVERLGADSCKVTWIANAHIKWFRTIMKGPLIKQLSDGFFRNLEEIKHMAETGQPHPRKVAKIAEEAA